MKRHPFQRRPRWLWMLSAATVASTVASSASAADFDAQGVLSFDPQAIYTESFESFTPGAFMNVVQGDALDGNAYLRVRAQGEDDKPDGIDVAVGPNAAAYVFRVFVRSETSWYPTISVRYENTPGVPHTYSTMFPTGRMTSDGWVELASTPVSIDGTRNPSVSVVLDSYDVDVDALEVVPVAGAYHANTTCSGVSSTVCDDGQFCIHGFCQDGDAMVPPLPSPAAKDLFVDVVQQKIRVFFGGVDSRQEPMQTALATLDGIRHATDAWTFWNGLAKSIIQLRDTHTRVFGLMNYIARAGRAFPVCMVEGDADVSHGLAPSDAQLADVLVSHVGPEKNLGLAPGDRLVAVDGQHPIAWAQSLIGHAWGVGLANDTTSHGLTVEMLNTLIPAFATTIEVIRCDAGTGTCSPPETIEASTFAADSEDTVHPQCDHRPAYHLASGNPDPVLHDSDDVRYGLLADSGPGEHLYGMIWNDTMWGYGSNPWSGAYGQFRQNAEGLILDHRTGNGGTADGAAYLTELSRNPHTVSVWALNTTLGMFDAPFSTTDGLSMFTQWENDPAHGWEVGSTSPRLDMRIAVLLARDVSGSDFFPFGVKGSPNTKLFGRTTMGAFSTFFRFETANFLNWTLASGDFVSEAGAPQIGHGVIPDVDAVPKQSDLMVGIDTVYELALEWVRCGDGGCQ